MNETQVKTDVWIF